MSELYNSIPPERELAFIHIASEQVDEALDSVVDDIASIDAIEQTVEMLESVDEGVTLGDEAEKYVHENGLSEAFKKELEFAKPPESDIALSAAHFLTDIYISSAFDESKLSREKLKHLKVTNTKTPEELRIALKQLLKEEDQ